MDVQVTAEDITNEWRPLSSAEAASIPGKSRSAWTRVQADTADIVDKITAAPAVVSVETVKSVMISMIVRVLKNQSSARSISKSADDWSKAITLDSSVSTGELYVTEYEHGLLNPTTGVPMYGAYVVGLGG